MILGKQMYSWAIVCDKKIFDVVDSALVAVKRHYIQWGISRGKQSKAEYSRVTRYHIQRSAVCASLKPIYMLQLIWIFS